ncbi:MAG: hypothetical protein KKH68_12020 [Proteobacteria bacterium]|nr:hypothetical protein [Pseudomonadota bacterium]
MASNFKIFIHRNNGSLRLKLMGDFDGSSAFELINTLKAYYGNVVEIVINTGGLASIHPFGMGVFQKNCAISNLTRGIVFTGKYGHAMAPQKDIFI